MPEGARSLARIQKDDLLHLAALAAHVEAGLFARTPEVAGRYAGHLLCRALCQGAALHYLDGKNGVKDFDVWSFYAARDDAEFPVRWRKAVDFGPSKFGRYPRPRHRQSHLAPALIWSFSQERLVSISSVKSLLGVRNDRGCGDSRR
jgi:hypothetical protein